MMLRGINAAVGEYREQHENNCTEVPTGTMEAPDFFRSIHSVRHKESKLVHSSSQDNCLFLKPKQSEDIFINGSMILTDLNYRGLVIGKIFWLAIGGPHGHQLALLLQRIACSRLAPLSQNPNELLAGGTRSHILVMNRSGRCTLMHDWKRKAIQRCTTASIE